MQNGRNTDGKFSDGNAGRPKGSRNKATIAIDSLLEGQAEALTQTAISKALDGDSIALRLCMDRIAPPMKDKPVVFPLAQMRDTMEIAPLLHLWPARLVSRSRNRSSTLRRESGNRTYSITASRMTSGLVLK